jgi:hypothetical protein
MYANRTQRAEHRSVRRQSAPPVMGSSASTSDLVRTDSDTWMTTDITSTVSTPVYIYQEPVALNTSRMI